MCPCCTFRRKGPAPGASAVMNVESSCRLATDRPRSRRLAVRMDDVSSMSTPSTVNDAPALGLDHALPSATSSSARSRAATRRQTAIHSSSSTLAGEAEELLQGLLVGRIDEGDAQGHAAAGLDLFADHLQAAA